MPPKLRHPMEKVVLSKNEQETKDRVTYLLKPYKAPPKQYDDLPPDAGWMP